MPCGGDVARDRIRQHRRRGRSEDGKKSYTDVLTSNTVREIVDGTWLFKALASLSCRWSGL